MPALDTLYIESNRLLASSMQALANALPGIARLERLHLVRFIITILNNSSNKKKKKVMNLMPMKKKRYRWKMYCKNDAQST